MKALKNLHSMYATMRAIVYVGLLMAVVGVTMAVISYFKVSE